MEHYFCMKIISHEAINETSGKNPNIEQQILDKQGIGRNNKRKEGIIPEWLTTYVTEDRKEYLRVRIQVKKVT